MQLVLHLAFVILPKAFASCSLANPGVTVEILEARDPDTDTPLSVQFQSRGCFSDTTVFDTSIEVGSLFEFFSNFGVDRQGAFVNAGRETRNVQLPFGANTIVEDPCDLSDGGDARQVPIDDGSSILPVGFLESQSEIYLPNGVTSFTDFNGFASISQATLADLRINPTPGASCTMNFKSGSTDLFIRFVVVEQFLPLVSEVSDRPLVYHPIVAN